MNEQELIQKADLLAADLRTSGGMLNPEQSNRFIRKLIDAPTILRVARTVPMNSDTLILNKIGIGSRILRAATPNTRLAQGDRSKPETSKVTLVAKEVIAEVLLPYEAIEDNIEGEDFVQTVLDLVAEKASEDLEELVVLGDTANVDPYLALMDGLVKRVTVNTVNAASAPISATVCKNVLKALPVKYRRSRSALRWLYTPDDVEDLISTIASRQTILGDQMLTGEQPVRLAGIVSESVTHLPLHTGFLTNPKNLIVGIRRRFTLESERLISERQLKFVLTARVAFNIEELDAIVKVTNLG